MIKVSVIVPVYNGEKYIDKCLDSLINQTISDIEIIVIDDGSTDNTYNKLLKYKNKIIIKKQKNKGVAAARNKGLDIASGEYIAFLDSDDFIDNNMYLKLYNYAKTNNYDIVECDFKYVDDYKVWEGNKDTVVDIKTNEEKKEYLINLFPVIWNKIYKKSVIDEFRFKNGVWAEDAEFLYRIIPNLKTIGKLNDELYYYYQRSISESRLFDERVYDYIDNFNGIVEYYKKNKLYEEYRNELEYCYVRYIYATFIKRASYFKDKTKYKKAVNTAIDNVKLYFPKYRKNLYFYKSIKGIYLVLFNRFFANILGIINRGK